MELTEQTVLMVQPEQQVLPELTELMVHKAQQVLQVPMELTVLTELMEQQA
jgi:hypothetical protein